MGILERVELLGDADNPSEARSKAGITKSRCVMPDAGKNDPKYAKLCKKRDKPKCRKSGTSIVASIYAGDCINTGVSICT